MTIVEAVKIVLTEYKKLTCKEITDKILEKNLYSFNTPNPKSMVYKAIRTHCQGLDFPSAHLIKHFVIVSGTRGNTVYSLLDHDNANICSNESFLTADSETEDDYLPEEMIHKYYELHTKNIKKQLLECVLNNDPTFFEHLVVKLLVELGYGYGTNSGIAVGKSHDGGIDGIINEDKLGLSKIFIQAKRYNPSHKISRKEIQAFAGAMKSAKKGVFITTSSFTKEATKEAKEQGDKNISLIDGSMLTELMLKAEVGIRSTKSFKTYEIDHSFFDLD